MASRVIRVFDPSRPKRQNARIGVPLKFVVAGQVLEALDWSLGGFRTNTSIPFRLGNEFMLSHIITDDERPIPVDEKAIVVRADAATGEVGIRFLTLGDKAFRLLEKAMMRRRG